MPFITLLFNFSFLFSKKAGDLYGALPFTRTGLLLTRGVSALIGGWFLMTTSYMGLVIINILPSVNGVTFTTVVVTYLYMLLVLIVLTAFCVLFGICCGGYFDVVISFAAINIAPPLIVALVMGIAEESVTGLIFDYKLLIYLTPIAFAFFKLLKIPLAIENPQLFLTATEKTTVFTVIGLAVFGFICVFAAIKLFKARKGETAGEAYSFKFMPILITVLVSIVGGFILAGILTGFFLELTVTFWMFFVVCAILCAIAIDTITNRSFKNIKRSVVSGLAAAAFMTAIVIGGLYIADYAEKRVPQADKIATVYLGGCEYREDIELVVNFHKSIVDCIDDVQENDIDYGEFPGVVNNCENFNFKYIMDDGSVIKRNYWYRSPEMRGLHDEILAIMQSDSFFKKYDECTVGKDDYKLVNVHSHSTKFTSMEDSGQQKNAILTEKEAKKLISLFKKEMQAADTGIFNEDVYGISISSNDWCELYIPVSFSETLSFLETKFAEYEALSD